MSTFTKKVGRAALRCRKGVLLASVAAMASGAWAAYNYSFELSTYNVPSAMTNLDNDNSYLTVYRGNDIVVKASIAELGSLHENKTLKLENTRASASYSTKFTLHNPNSGVSVTEDNGTVKKVAFSIGWEGDDELLKEYNSGIQDSWAGNVSDWRITLEGIANFKDGTQEDVYISQNIASYTSNKSGVYFTTSAAFSAAPEPTSAVLLLLGFAGVALKRKRVA